MTKCEKMHFLFVLVDSRLEPQKIDLNFIEMLGENGIPFGIIFTKGDKLSKTQLEKSINSYVKILKQQWEEMPPMFVSSSATAMGRDEILSFIEECQNMAHDQIEEEDVDVEESEIIAEQEDSQI